MEIKIIMAEKEYTFTKFSSNAFYEKITERLIELAEIQDGGRIIDLACGTGLVTKRIMAHLSDARNTMIIGVDHSATALREAVLELKDVKDSAVVFMESQVEQLGEAIKEKVDAVFYCNAIHYVPDKDELIQGIAKTIKPGGKFVFNTSASIYNPVLFLIELMMSKLYFGTLLSNALIIVKLQIYTFWI